MKLDIKFDIDNMEIDAEFSENHMELDADFGEIIRVKEYVGGEAYKGQYEVTPTVKGLTLPTKERVLEEDIKILEIPFFNVSNTAGGSTVYIGRSLD